MAGIDVNSTLVRLCQVKVAQNIKTLGRNISGLPVGVWRDLLTILNIDQLDKIEAVALINGISTTPVWKALWKIVANPKHHTLQGECSGDLNYKQMCMERIFYLVMFGKIQSKHENMWYFYKLDRISILTLTAHYVRTFTEFSIVKMAMTPKLVCQIIGILENGVTEIRLPNRESWFQNTMFFKLVLHRLLDHAHVRKVVLCLREESPLLGLILWRCQDSSALVQEPSAKRSDLFQRLVDLTQSMEDSCKHFHALFPRRSSCGRGQIHTLDIVVPKADFTIVTEALPTCVYLESLHLHFEWTLSSNQISQLLNSLRGLFQKADCSLTSLSLTLPCSNKIVVNVLNVCPTLRNLTLDITSKYRRKDPEEKEDSNSEEDSEEDLDSDSEEEKQNDSDLDSDSEEEKLKQKDSDFDSDSEEEQLKQKDLDPEEDLDSDSEEEQLKQKDLDPEEDLDSDSEEEKLKQKDSDSEEDSDSDSDSEEEKLKQKDSDSEEDSDSDSEEYSLSVTEITTTDLCLETLTVKSVDYTLCPFEVIVNKTPKLRSLDLTGNFFYPAKIFLTLANSNHVLKVLKIRDAILDHHQQEIIQLLEHSELEELSLIDFGHIFENCTGKKRVMELLVKALKKVSTLRALTLSLNQIAGSTATMAKLFKEPCPSKITKLDLRTNVCKADDILKFAKLLEIYKPTQRLDLNLPFNMLFWEPEVKHRILKKLSPYCDLH